MDREKLSRKVREADDRLHEVLAEAEQLMKKRRISMTFESDLRYAISLYQTAVVKALREQDKRIAQLEQATRINEVKYVHRRGQSMTDASPVDRFRQVYIASGDPKQAGRPAEILWGLKINRTTVKLDNVPFAYSALALGDLVRVGKDGQILEILEHGARTRLLKYAEGSTQTEAQLQRKYVAVKEKLEPYDIVTERMGAGLCSASVPADLDEAKLSILVEQAGAEVIGSESENDGMQGVPES